MARKALYLHCLLSFNFIRTNLVLCVYVLIEKRKQQFYAIGFHLHRRRVLFLEMRLVYKSNNNTFVECHSTAASEAVNAVCDVSALKIHMSKNAHDALEAFPEYVTESRGDIFIKVNITHCLSLLYYNHFLCHFYLNCDD